jgi:hypothetical protein
MPGRTGFVIALLVSVVALTPGRTAACSCAALGTANPLESADVAFTGVVARVDDPVGPISLWSSGFDPLLYTFAVESVLKGDMGEFVVIRTGRGGGDCGLSMSVGDRWSIFASGREDELWVGICGSSVALARGITPPAAPNPLGPDLWSIGALFALGLTSLGVIAVVLMRRRRLARETTN